jgi:hypothetical protein
MEKVKDKIRIQNKITSKETAHIQLKGSLNNFY